MGRFHPRLTCAGLMATVCTILSLACSGDSDRSRATSRTTSADPLYLPSELLEQGEALESQDSLVPALQCYDSCIALAGRQGGDRRVLARGLAARARVHLELDLFGRAEVDARAALELEESFPESTPARRASLWLDLAESHEGGKQLAQADSTSDSALAWSSIATPPDTALHTRALLDRGRILVLLDRAAEAESLLTTAIAMLDSNPAALEEKRWEARSLLGWCQVRQGRLALAEPLLLRSYAGLSGRLGADHPQVRAAAARLAELYDRWQKPDLFAHYQALATHTAISESPE